MSESEVYVCKCTHLSLGHSPVLCLRPVKVVHRGVEAGEDGGRDEERQVLVEKLLLLWFL